MRKFAKFALWLCLGPFFPTPAAAVTAISNSNAYMVENTTGTNGCYEFQTTPTCAAQIQNLSVQLSTSSIPPGSTNYIQNTLSPNIATQQFSVQTGTITGNGFVNNLTATVYTLNKSSSNSCGYLIGTTVQTVKFTDTSTTTSSGTGYTITTTTTTINPKCASDEIRVTATGNLGFTVGTAATVSSTIFRGATDLSTAGKGFASLFGATGTNSFPTTMVVPDSPGTISNTGYGVQIKSSSAGEAQWNTENGAAQNATILLEDIAQ